MPSNRLGTKGWHMDYRPQRRYLAMALSPFGFDCTRMLQTQRLAKPADEKAGQVSDFYPQSLVRENRKLLQAGFEEIVTVFEFPLFGGLFAGL